MEDCAMDGVEVTGGTPDPGKKTEHRPNDVSSTEGKTDDVKSMEGKMDTEEGTEGTYDAANTTKGNTNAAEGNTNAAKTTEDIRDAAESTEITSDAAKTTERTQNTVVGGRTFKDVDLLTGPGTILSDDEVDRLSDSDSEEENLEIRYTRKNEDKSDMAFYRDFEHRESDLSYQKDTWDEIMKYLKPDVSTFNSTMGETIEEVLNIEQKTEKRIMNRNNNATPSDTNILDPEKVDSVQELMFGKRHVKDVVKVNEDHVKRKERQSHQPEKMKSKEEANLEEEVNKIFEDSQPYITDKTFLQMNLSRPMMKAIEHLGYDVPTPVQAAAIPLALQGRDICSCAATGTGKTAAFMIPILERLVYKPKFDVYTRVLVMVPTRELGVQVFTVSKELAKHTNVSMSLSVGGLDLKTQESELKKAPDIVIATPGRLIDHVLNCPGFDLANIEILVLDEADRLLDDRYKAQIKQVISECAPNRQVMLFSATMTAEVKELGLLSLKNPVKVFVNENTDVAKHLRQEFIRLKREKDRDAVLVYLILRTFFSNCLVFTDTKTEVHKLFVLLKVLGVKAGEIHSDLTQNERLLHLKKFKDREIDVLVSTDVTARGLDIEGIKTIINHKVPREYIKYVHRVGRTARAGKGGRAISLFSDSQFPILRNIKKHSKSPLYQRILDKDLIEKYVTLVDRKQTSVTHILMEENSKKQMLKMEKDIERGKRKLQRTEMIVKKRQQGDSANWTKPKEPRRRVWYETEKDRIIAKTKERTKAGNEKKESRFTLQQKLLRTVPKKDQPLVKSLRCEQRLAKQKQKTKRLTHRNENDPKTISAALNKGKSGKKQKQAGGTSNAIKNNKKSNKNKKMKGSMASSFTRELVDVRREAVKKHRSAGTFLDRKIAYESKDHDTMLESK